MQCQGHHGKCDLLRVILVLGETSSSSLPGTSTYAPSVAIAHFWFKSTATMDIKPFFSVVLLLTQANSFYIPLPLSSTTALPHCSSLRSTSDDNIEEVRRQAAQDDAEWYNALMGELSPPPLPQEAPGIDLGDSPEEELGSPCFKEKREEQVRPDQLP